MGCTSSREVRRDRRRSLSPYVKTFSVSVPIGSQRKDDSFHITNLESDEEMMKSTNYLKHKISAEIRVSKTPATNLHYELEPEIINVWELMDGLDDITPLRPSIASNTNEESERYSPANLTSENYVEFDLDIISYFRKTMAELSPKEASLEDNDIPRFVGIVDAEKSKVSPLKECPPGGERKLVLYLTSLRGVRKTFEDCCNVKVIIQGYGFRIDERDVSMHGGFKDELNEILGPGCCGRLPRVFANGKYLGGAEEVIQMHEAGDLEEALRDCEVVVMENRLSVEVCEGCGDVRFVPCETCSGSCKVFVEEDEERGEKGIGGFRRCSECNENGLVRCPLCCY